MIIFIYDTNIEIYLFLYYIVNDNVLALMSQIVTDMYMEPTYATLPRYIFSSFQSGVTKIQSIYLDILFKLIKKEINYSKVSNFFFFKNFFFFLKKNIIKSTLGDYS